MRARSALALQPVAPEAPRAPATLHAISSHKVFAKCVA